MTSLKNICELIDISSESENEEKPEGASTPLPRNTKPIFRVVLEIFHSSIEAIADNEADFDWSLDSLETDCKRLKLSNSFETGEYSRSSINSEYSEIIENPESPDEQLQEDDIKNTTNSEIFIVDSHKRQCPQSITSAVIADSLEQVAREDADSYSVTPPGPLRKINFQPVAR